MKKFLFLFLPLLMFAGEKVQKLAAGDQYVYEMNYYLSKDRTINYRLIYDVVSIDENGSALVSCSHQGDNPMWVVSDEYKVRIGGDKKISIENPFWPLGDTKWERRVKKQAQFYLFSYDYFVEGQAQEFAMEHKWSDEFQAKVFYFSYDKERSRCCSSYMESLEIIACSEDGTTLSYKWWEKGKLLYEITRVQDQSG